MRVLYVCTANICRSASAQQMLREAVGSAPELAGIEVNSAGTAAMEGAAGCSVAPGLAGHSLEHRSRPLTAELLAWADLILPAARDHRRAILEMDPGSRDRTLTVRQAGRIADWLVGTGMAAAARDRGRGPEGTAAWVERFPPGDARRDVQALPEDLPQRWLWLVSEMDAARGMVGVPLGAEPDPSAPRRRSRLGRPGRSDPSPAHPDDIPDPHVLGMGLHALAYEQIASSTDALVRLLQEVASPT